MYFAQHDERVGRAIPRNPYGSSALLQGETSKQKTLAEFMELGNALLVATGAFGEGIDVRAMH